MNELGELKVLKHQLQNLKCQRKSFKARITELNKENGELRTNINAKDSKIKRMANTAETMKSLNAAQQERIIAEENQRLTLYRKIDDLESAIVVYENKARIIQDILKL